MVDFCFFYHPHTYDIDPGAQVGLGLLLLATYAKKLGASVRVINAQSSSSIARAVLKIPRCKYLMMYGCLIDKPIIEEIGIISRPRSDGICIGGPIARSKIRNVDYIIMGFGEDLVHSLVHDNLSWHPEKLDHDINYYPFPDRSLIEGAYGGDIFKNGRESCDVSTTLLTSRGCRFKCAFCTSGSEEFFQEYSLDRIEKELEHCLSLGIKNIRISDDNLVGNPKRLEKLCNLFKKANIKWRGSIRVSPSSIKMYQMMKESGCEELSFGIESGDQDVLNLLNKGVTISQSKKAIQNANKAHILTRALIMMGTPGETEDTLYKNMAWVEEAKPNMVSLKIFVPYPGTDIYHNPEKYKCKIHLPLKEVNNSAYRPDGSKPEANIDNDNLSSRKLTWQFIKMKTYLEAGGIENRG